MAKGTAYTQQFKEDAVRYKKEHPELSYQTAASNLNISISALKTWIRKAKENGGDVPTRGAGNYSSDEAKENARLQRELRDTKDALEVLKKPSVSWETDTGNLHINCWIRGGNTSLSGETPELCQWDTEASSA